MPKISHSTLFAVQRPRILTRRLRISSSSFLRMHYEGQIFVAIGKKGWKSTRRWGRNRQSFQYYDDDDEDEYCYEYEGDDRYDDNDAYYDDDDDDYDYDGYEKFDRDLYSYGTEASRDGDVSAGGEIIGEDQQAWERFDGGAAEILWPSGDLIDDPKSIIHFIGGTGIGSVPPRTAYGPLLSSLAAHGNIVIATSVPAPFGQIQSQFNHEFLAAECRRRFEGAYSAVIEDEYGSEEAGRIPVIGMGHSLGCRLHLLLGCNYDDRGRRRRGRKDLQSPSANILLAFNNHPASEAIPYLREASKFVRGLDRFRRGVVTPVVDKTADVIADGIYTVRRATRARGAVGRVLEFVEIVPHAVSDFIRGYEDDEDEIAQDSMGGRGRLLDNGPIPIEFSPNSEELWEKIRSSYAVRSNLLVQFDRDTIDQSPELAGVLDERKFSTDVNDDKKEEGDLRYARLPGTHVTPNWVGVAQQPRRGINVPGFNPAVTNVYDPHKNHGILVDSILSYIDYLTESNQGAEKGKEEQEDLVVVAKQ